MGIDDLFYKKTYLPRLTPIACAICAVVFVALNLLGSEATWAQRAVWGFYPDSALWEGKPWALITSVFVHLQLLHFAFNMYWLWILGNVLEEEIGPARFLLFFLGAAITSSAYELLFMGGMGIGMSGVGYALFGFGWIARHKMRSFDAVLNQQTVSMFLIWFVFCIVLTYTNIQPIANMAHFAGLVFGVLVAGIFVERGNLTPQHFGINKEGQGAVFTGIEAMKQRSQKGVALLSVLLGVMLLGSLTPLFWCPMSFLWVTQKAEKEEKAGHDEAAIAWYQWSMRVGQSPAWAWWQIAEIHRKRGNMTAYSQALEKSDQETTDSEDTDSDE